MSTDPLGTSAGQVGDADSSGLTNSYHNIPDVSVEAIASRVIPRQMQSGALRGTQEVGGPDLVIDSANKRIGINKIVNTEDEFAVELDENGLAISDGTITFISITKDGIILNDGTTDRILLGKDVGGF